MKDIVACILYLGILFYASYIDIECQIVSNWIHIAILILAFASGRGNRQTVISSFIITMPVLFYAAWKDHMGGGDVKFIFSNTVLLGFWGIYIALLLGMSLLLIRYAIIRFYKKRSLKNIVFPLIPYLSIGCSISFLISFYANNSV